MQMRPCLWKELEKHNQLKPEWKPGVFHIWGSSFWEFENAAPQITVAIVEDNDGQVHEVMPTNIKFIK